MHWTEENRLYDLGFRRGAGGVFLKTTGTCTYELSHCTKDQYIFSVKCPDKFEIYSARPMAAMWDLMEEAGAFDTFSGRANHGSIPLSAREAALNQ